MAMSKIKLVGALSVLTVASVMGQSSCVQLNATVLSSCPCDDATLTFTLEGETSVQANTVNLALVLDGSGSISASEFAEEQDFAKDAVNAFANRNLFDNGGTASYVQYSSALVSSDSFGSAQLFTDFVNNDVQASAGTTTSVGIDEGTRLLGVNPATASFMIVITDGQSSSITATTAAADAARAENIIVFAVGVGTGTGDAELLAIGGDPTNVFEVADFALLDAALASILSSSGGSVIPCPSTGATVTIEFSVPADSTVSGSISGNTVIFSAADLESTPTEFDVLLDVCNEVPGGSVVVTADYTDDQGNTPDLSILTGLVVGNDLCEAPTPAPTPKPTNKDKTPPKRGKRLKKGRAKRSQYLGCYLNDSRHRVLNGPMTSSRHMTAQMCADSCRYSGWEYFATAYGSECHCGSSRPTRKGGVCDYECFGDRSRACGGVGCMSVYRSKNYRGH